MAVGRGERGEGVRGLAPSSLARFDGTFQEGKPTGGQAEACPPVGRRKEAGPRREWRIGIQRVRLSPMSA